MKKLMQSLLILAALGFAAGSISPVRAASAAVASAAQAPAPIPVPTQFETVITDGQWRFLGIGDAPFDVRWFKLVVTKAGWFDVQTAPYPATMGEPVVTDTMMRIYRTGDGETLTLAGKNDNRGPDPFSRLVMRLEPATYYIKIQAPDNQRGNFYYKVTKGGNSSYVSLSLKDNQWQTYERVVPVRSEVYGLKPKYYQVGERSDLKNAKWQRYVAAAQYTLSSGNGVKTVYFRVKDDKGRQSDIVSRTIRLNERIPVTLGIAQRSVIASALATKAFAFTIKKYGGFEFEITPEKKAGAPYLKRYQVELAGPNNERNIIDLRSFDDQSARLGYNLGSGTYYVMVTGGSESSPAQDSPTTYFTGAFSIKVAQHSGAPTVYDLKILGDGVSVPGKRFGLSFTVLGSPKEYVVNETGDFDGVAWTPYTRRPVITLSAGAGWKTVYFKVRDASSRDSAVVSASIFLAEPTALALGGAPITARPFTTGSYKYFIFTAPNDGRYVVETTDAQSRPITSQFTVTGAVFGAQLTPVSSENTGSISRKTYALKAGSYLVRIGSQSQNPEDETQPGEFTLRVYTAQ